LLRVWELQRGWHAPRGTSDADARLPAPRQPVSEIGGDIRANATTSKLVLLALHFPRLRIIWSRSLHATADIFRSLKANQDEPDPVTAAATGRCPPPPHGTHRTTPSCLLFHDRALLDATPNHPAMHC
jgi:hypothetical protein